MNLITNKTPHQLFITGMALTCLGTTLSISFQGVAQPQENPPSSGDAVPQPTGTPAAPVSPTSPLTNPPILPPVPTPLNPPAPTYTSPLASPSPLSTTTPPPTFSLPPVPKVSAPSRSTKAVGPITGTGTTGNIAKFTGSNAIGNSVLVERSGKVGLGTTAPTGSLSVVSNSSSPALYGSNAGTGTAMQALSKGGVGVQGETNSTGNTVAGVLGRINPTAPGISSAGVRGINNSTNTKGYGVYGSHAGSGPGIYGTSASGSAVLGDSINGTGVSGRHTASSGTAPGIVGITNSTSAGTGAVGATGVLGVVNSTSPGSSSAGVRGINNGTSYSGYGVYGSQAGNGIGVYGSSPKGYGIQGSSTDGTGVYGSSTSSTGVYGTSSSGVGVYGYSSTNSGTYGYSYSENGVYGQSYNGTGVYGASTNGLAGNFAGDVTVEGDVMITGNLAKASGSFKIDHPLHPGTQYLSHSFVESPDMMNVYNGNTTTNAKGEAWVTLPTYFQALNRDFRYQLTPIGQFAQAIVGQKIAGNRFLIKTSKPGVEVSWQVTGIRNDAYAREHRIKVEETKTGDERGKYLYPAGFGAGSDKQIGPNSSRLASR